MSKIINVFGEEETDPICQFRNCYHPLTWHEGHDDRCDCHHFANVVFGVKGRNE